jgi:CelD/BcsL family acetyltransferase involved in cellulose biosynthesis
VAVDDGARRQLWEGIAGECPRRLLLAGMRTGSRPTAIATEVFHRAGYGVLPSVREDASPYLPLPPSLEELFARLSHHARKQLRRKRRHLEAAGRVTDRLQTGGGGWERDLDTFLRIEASGWKGREGTAILSDTSTEQLFRGFARGAAERGWLRLHVLELDGTPIAAAVGASIGRESYFIKDGYDEAFAELSPGAVLAVERIRQAIDEGLQGVDMLGQAQQHKTRWTEETRPRQRLRIFAGLLGRVAERRWNRHLHPTLVTFRDRARDDPALRRRLQRVEPVLNRLTRT